LQIKLIPVNLKKLNFFMNYFLATYIDFIQSIGFIFICTLSVFVARKLILDNSKENYIESVTVRVDE
tara:strand:- start:498 stop:698 length:201 start_codon:yes stop_codon:yes gene_type:complete